MKLIIVVALACLALTEGGLVLHELESLSSRTSSIDLKSVLTTYAIGEETKALPNQFPYQVYYYIFGKKTFCGGTIIKNNVVLTAAHCVNDINIKRVQVYAGVYNVKLQENVWQVMQSKNIIVHNQFDANTFKHDIALIIFEDSFDLEENTVATIDYYTKTTDLKNVEATASGWGWRHNEKKGVNDELHYITNHIISNDDCIKELGTKVTENTICLKAIEGTGACIIDEGGPLQIAEGNNLYQVGIYSFGSKVGCEKGKPTAFTRVSKYATWILENLPK